MSEKGFDYDRMVEDAMRGVVREALAQAAAHGFPGKHHFFISFRTTAPGVIMPSRLRAQYPQEITIVIQHQYWNLNAAETFFEIDLAFGGRREHLVVPFAALTGFADPEAQFGLHFGADGVVSSVKDAPQTAAPAAPERPKPAAVPADAPGAEAPPEPGEKIVSLDSFRPKK